MIETTRVLLLLVSSNFYSVKIFRYNYNVEGSTAPSMLNPSLPCVVALHQSYTKLQFLFIKIVGYLAIYMHFSNTLTHTARAGIRFKYFSILANRNIVFVYFFCSDLTLCRHNSLGKSLFATDRLVRHSGIHSFAIFESVGKGG